ncbi:hypothetical protein RhiirB3_438701 [Rhizophagus irregularis]|nr:hypothetical protein RhiirB3_438701 [Rhizophagus irregularis]
MACSKIFSGNLPELTSKIMQNFQEDFSTLHSCVLVSRSWCRLAIPLLWEDPFYKYLPKNYHFIDIYLDKLNKDDKVKLNEYGIITDLFPSNTLFNYPKFIKCLNIKNTVSSIKNWIENAKVSSYDKDLKLSNFIFFSLIKVFIENEASLHTFEVQYIFNSDYFKSSFQLILHNPNFICNVKDLKFDFRRLTSNLLSSLKCFYSNCKSISSLYIYSLIENYAVKDLSKIIHSQQNLKKICFDSEICILKSLKNSNCSNTLKTIIFYGIDFENLKFDFNEIFEQLNVLESIHILYCSSPLNSTIIQQIVNLTKPFKLKSLFIDEFYATQIESLKLLLQKSGNYLENIGFELSMDHETDLQFIKLIKIYFNNIIFLEVFGYGDQNIFASFDLIKNVQQNLNYLTINSQSKLSSIILQNLRQILPNRLEYLSLDLKFSINDLEVLFKDTKNVFIRKLLIINRQESDDILPCIKKYIMKEKRVAYLAVKVFFISSNRVTTIKDLFHSKDEVEEFKLYDIQVTNYDVSRIQVLRDLEAESGR